MTNSSSFDSLRMWMRTTKATIRPTTEWRMHFRSEPVPTRFKLVLSTLDSSFSIFGMPSTATVLCMMAKWYVTLAGRNGFY